MKIVLFLTAFLLSAVAKSEEIAMADTMRSNGKIYVVVAVLGVILLGLILYLISIDKKVKKLEENKRA